jgi:Haem-binding domain/Cytochrome P460
VAFKSSDSARVAIWLAAVLFLAFLALQLIRPTLDNPPVTAEIHASAEVKRVLRQSCYNCHSNETRLPWFDQIVPAYWIVAGDVQHARMRLNFSEIGASPTAKQRATLFEAVNQIQAGAMPLPAYLALHPEARVSKEALAVLRNYLNSSLPSLPADPAPADAQYAKWIAEGAKPLTVEPEPNDVEFLPDYKNWNAISSTDRFDNGTMRVILANDIATKAIAAKHTNPWPDGSALAKVTWRQQPDGAGLIRTGAFQQVEFMIKDKRQYASTLGWGFGRWLGAELKPYGVGPGFVAECVGCHTPLHKQDYVFTSPHATPQQAVITSSIDHRNGTMSTLFGNPIAVHYARSHADANYPADAAFTLVTWKQQEDGRWFGGNVPAAQVSVETVTAPAQRAAVIP